MIPFLRKNTNWIFSILVILLIFSSCKKDESLPPTDMKYNYFPNNIGHWVIYKVDSVDYNNTLSPCDTFSYYIKEIIESTFIDNSGRETQRIERYRKETDTSDWYIKDVWMINRTPSDAQKVEEDTRFVKLKFPVVENTKWNGNAYNTLDSWEYELIDVDKPYSINGMSFDSSATVMQYDDFNEIIISRDYSEEVFVKNIGLVYKKFIHLKKLPSGIITSGEVYSYTIQSFGN
ncbi:MAG: hypothetical protein HXX09_05085 [Bacteroidetes bacterium]|nr:hypothetical protein [Bacteroidota bacterium]